MPLQGNGLNEYDKNHFRPPREFVFWLANNGKRQNVKSARDHDEMAVGDLFREADQEGNVQSKNQLIGFS